MDSSTSSLGPLPPSHSSPLGLTPQSEFSKQLDVLSQLFEPITQTEHTKIEITHEISSLRDQIKGLESSLKNSRKKLIKLTQRIQDAALATDTQRTKLIFQIHKEEFHIENYANALNAHQSQLIQKTALLHQTEEAQEEMLGASSEVIQKFDPLSPSPALGEEEIFQLFGIENQLREILEIGSDFDRTKYEELYRQHVLPLFKKAKQVIKKSSKQFAIQAATAKGQAAQVGIKAIKTRTEQNPMMSSNVESSQPVFLLPTEKAVFKAPSKRAEEEASHVDALFDLASPQAVVGTFSIQTTSTEHFGIPFSQTHREIGYPLSKLSPTLLLKMEPLLSPGDRSVLYYYQAHPTTNERLLNYNTLAQQKWQIKFSEEEDWQEMTLKQIQSLYVQDKLPITAQIKEASSDPLLKPLSFQQHIESDTPLFNALTYFPTVDSDSPLYIILDLEHPAREKAYTLCTQCLWDYVDHQGEKHQVDFKTLYLRHLNKETARIEEDPITPPAFRGSKPTVSDLRLALTTPLKVVGSQLIKKVARTSSTSPLKDIQTKPFIEDMVLSNTLQTIHPKALNKIMDRLRPEDGLNAVLTGVFQLLDLHGANLGFAPVSTPDYERFKNMTFTLSPHKTPIHFKDLLLDFLDGKISLSTEIKFQENGETIQKPLSDLPDLLAVLEGRWRLVIFDTDFSLGDSRVLHYQIRGGKKEHLIPLRNVLLELNWRDHPLSPESMECIKTSFEHEKAIQQWAKREDAPIYQRLSKTTQGVVTTTLQPILEKYDLSTFRKKNSRITVQDLQNKFVTQICDMSVPGNAAFWTTIEKDLSLVRVRKGDTFDLIAQRHHQDSDTLKRLNGAVTFAPGAEIQVPYDVTTLTPLATKRRTEIAKQFFPRLTPKQQTSLFERQTGLKEYVTKYEALSNSLLEGEPLLNQLEQFFTMSSNPLTSVEKEEGLEEIQLLRTLTLTPDFQSHLDAFKTKTLAQCIPTFHLLLNAMYPLLANVSEINTIVYGKVQGGKNIGLYTTPLETILAKAETHPIKSSLLKELVKPVREEIAATPDPSFFGNWV